MLLPFFRPMPPVRIPQPFDDPAWISRTEAGRLSGACVGRGRAGAARLRNGRTFRQFAPLTDALASQLPDGIYDGEVVVLDCEGRSFCASHGRFATALSTLMSGWHRESRLRQVRQPVEDPEADPEVEPRLEHVAVDIGGSGPEGATLCAIQRNVRWLSWFSHRTVEWR